MSKKKRIKKGVRLIRAWLPRSSPLAQKIGRSGWVSLWQLGMTIAEAKAAGLELSNESN